MPFTFKLAKRLALSKAVDTTAARALSVLQQVFDPPGPRCSSLPNVCHVVAEHPSSQMGLRVVPLTP